MLSHMFGMAVQIIIGLAVLIFLYQVFLSDLIGDKMKENRELREHLDSLDKIARVKLTSDDPKEIEKFITDNAKSLSDQTVGALVSRIEQIKDDRVIKGDALKHQIESLEDPVASKKVARK